MGIGQESSGSAAEAPTGGDETRLPRPVGSGEGAHWCWGQHGSQALPLSVRRPAQPLDGGEWMGNPDPNRNKRSTTCLKMPPQTLTSHVCTYKYMRMS